MTTGTGTGQEEAEDGSDEHSEESDISQGLRHAEGCGLNQVAGAWRCIYVSVDEQ